MKTKEKLLHIATELFSRYGVDRTGTLDIAERAGVAKSVIHHYYDSKEDLYQQALDLAYDAYHDDKANEPQVILLVRRLLDLGDFEQARKVLNEYF